MRIISFHIDKSKRRGKSLEFNNENNTALLRISNNKELIFKISKKLLKEISKKQISRINLEDLKFVPLYRNCRIDIDTASNNNNHILADIEVGEDKEIATVKLNGIIGLTKIIQDNSIISGIHEITFAGIIEENNWEIIVYTTDGTRIKITEYGTFKNKVNIEINKQVGRIEIKRLLKLPKNVYVVGTDYKTERKEGYVSILARDLFNKHFKIDDKNLKKIIISETVSGYKKQKIINKYKKYII